MPTYEYVCTACEHHWEEVQKISEDPLQVCPKCAQSTAKRQISGGNFILKGGGWYADLYSSPSGSKKNGEAKSAEKSEGSSSESKPAEKKATTESSSTSTSTSTSSSSGGSSSGGSSSGSAS